MLTRRRGCPLQTGLPSPSVLVVAAVVTLALLTPAAPARAQALASTAGAAVQPPASVDPLSGADRIRWVTKSTIGPTSLLAGVISSGWGVARETPPEYSPDWKGFGARFGMRLSGVSLSNAIEGGLGAGWGEDPRYRRSGRGGIWPRVGHALKLSVMAARADGRLRPAYARYGAIVGSNIISNSWRVPSDSSGNDAIARSALGVSGRVVGNLFEEFWPDLWDRIH
jgi:hypothetical protein